MAHHFVHPAALTPAALRRARDRVRAHLPFAVYCAATLAAMAYILDLICRAAG